MTNSVDRFATVYEMLSRELGNKTGERLFRKIILIFGQGRRIRVPKIILQNSYKSSYYWNPHRGNNPELFKNVRDLLFAEIGHSTGAAIFSRLIIDLCPGKKLTVPVYICNKEICKCHGYTACIKRKELHEKIKNDFNGINHQELAIKYHYSKRHIRRIVNE